MNKIIKIVLIIIPIILSAILVFNIYNYINLSEKNKIQTQILKEHNEKMTILNNNNNNQNNILKKLKEENKDKIVEYERWLKWEKEIQEKVN